MPWQANKRIGDKKVCKIFKNSLTKAFVISIIKIHSRIYTKHIKRRESDDEGRIGEKIRYGRADGGRGNGVSETCKACATRVRQVRDDEEEISVRA